MFDAEEVNKMHYKDIKNEHNFDIKFPVVVRN